MCNLAPLVCGVTHGRLNLCLPRTVGPRLESRDKGSDKKASKFKLAFSPCHPRVGRPQRRWHTHSKTPRLASGAGPRAASGGRLVSCLRQTLRSEEGSVLSGLPVGSLSTGLFFTPCGRFSKPGMELSRLQPGRLEKAKGEDGACASEERPDGAAPCPVGG